MRGARWCSPDPDVADERDHGALGADLSPRTAGPHVDLELAPPAACTTPVRDPLQQPPATPCPGAARAAAPRTRAGHRARPNHPPSHPKTRPPRRNPARVRTCRLNSTDGKIGTR